MVCLPASVLLGFCFLRVILRAYLLIPFFHLRWCDAMATTVLTLLRLRLRLRLLFGFLFGFWWWWWWWLLPAS